MKASDIFTQEEIKQIKYINKLFNGKVTGIFDKYPKEFDNGIQNKKQLRNRRIL